jgi:hypothetical protein
MMKSLLFSVIYHNKAHHNNYIISHVHDKFKMYVAGYSTLDKPNTFSNVSLYRNTVCR